MNTTRIPNVLLPAISISLIMFLQGAGSSCAAAESGALEIKSPVAGVSVQVVGRQQITVPGDSAVFGRTGYDLLVLMPGDFDRDTLEMSGPFGLIRDARLETLPGTWKIGASGTDPRANIAEPEPFVVIEGSSHGGYGSRPLYAMPLSKLLDGRPQEEALSLPSGLHSPMVVRNGDRLFATGYTYERNPDAASISHGRGRLQAQNLAVYEIADTEPVMVGVVERFSEHAENNLVSAMTTEGVIHLIASEVLVSDGNSSRIHHLMFDSKTNQWVGTEVVFVRREFTSTVTPRLARNLSSLDAFWLPEGGQTRRSTDGLYAFRLGEAAAWRLTDARGEYAILPDADGHGSLLVGVAVHPSEDGLVRWFVRRGDVWYSAGETDLGTRLYTLNTSGTEPFALWREEKSGTIHAAFTSRDGLQIIDLQMTE